MKVLIENVSLLVKEERKRGVENHGYFHSDHEAFAVIDEEVRETIAEVGLITTNCTEFRDAVYKDSAECVKADAIDRIKNAAILCAYEAMQVAAMCEKWIEGKDKEHE